MKSIIVLSLVFSLLIGFTPFALAESQTLSTDGGILDVKLEYDDIVLGELTTLRTDFINPQNQNIQEHIDWRFSVSKDGEIVWGPTQLSHTSEGSLKNLKYEFAENGKYTLEYEIEGILFRIIPLEKVSFEIIVGDVEESIEKIPNWIKNNAGWWAKDIISDSEFVSAIQFLIKEEILMIPATSAAESQEKDIPNWIKNNAGWWAQGQISDNDFINGIQYLISVGIINVSEQNSVQKLVGQFSDADFIHRTSGIATLIIYEDKRTLEFENFETLGGPDLFVYLSSDKSSKDFIDLGKIEKFKGEQSYSIDSSVDLERYNNVLIWCKAFGVLFGSAELK